MAHEDQKDFNAMLRRDSGMPRIQIVTDEATIRKYGGSRMYFAPPLDYDRAMRTVPPGKQNPGREFSRQTAMVPCLHRA